jgi:hypothetical protein
VTAPDPLLAAVERLTKEVFGLRGDIARLLDRIEEYDDEEARLAPILRDALRPPKTVAEAMAQIAHAGEVIRGVEIDIQSARNKIETIAADPHRRDSFKKEAVRSPARDEAEKLFSRGARS